MNTNQTVSLEVTTLRSGSRIVRPAGSCGTCGWSPRAWTAAVQGRRETAQSAFLRANRNWTAAQVSP